MSVSTLSFSSGLIIAVRTFQRAFFIGCENFGYSAGQSSDKEIENNRKKTEINESKLEAKQNGPAVKAKPFFTGYMKLTALSCSRFVSGIQWAYRFIVMPISECPIISCSVLGGIPLSIHLVANVSRNA